MRRGWYLLQQLRAERWPLPRLRAYQLRRLQRLLAGGYRDVPFYRALMDGAGVHPADITTLEDIQRLPLVDKAMMRSVPELERFSRSIANNADVTRIYTSGSHGEPFSFLVDQSYNRWRKAQYLRPYLTNGRRPGQRVLRLTAFPERGDTWLARIGLLTERRMNCTAKGPDLLQALRAYQPHIVQGYASALKVLALEIRRTGAMVPTVQRVFSDSEVLTPETRRLVESALGAPVLDIYGSFEADNIGYECEYQHGMHLALDSVIAEISDDDGQILPPGESGELIITILHNHLMPFIRYRMGDVARWLPDPCPCGRTFPLLQFMSGRRCDMLRLADGHEISPQALVAQFDDAVDEFVEFKIIQTAVNTFSVYVVPEVSLSRTVIEARIHKLIKAVIPSAKIHIEILEHIPRTAAGKLLSFSCQMEPP